MSPEGRRLFELGAAMAREAGQCNLELIRRTSPPIHTSPFEPPDYGPPKREENPDDE